MFFLVLLGVAIVTPIIIIISLPGSIPTFWQVWSSFSAERPHQHFIRTLVFTFGLPEYLSEPRYVRNEFLVGFNHVSFPAFFHLILDDDPNWRIFFSGGSMPPTGFGSKKTRLRRLGTEQRPTWLKLGRQDKLVNRLGFWVSFLFFFFLGFFFYEQFHGDYGDYGDLANT